MKPFKAFALSFLLATSLGSGFFVSAAEIHQISCDQYLKSRGLQKPQGISQKFLWRRFHRQWLPRRISSKKGFQRAVRKSVKILTRLQQKQGLSMPQGLSRFERQAYGWAERALLTEEFRDLSKEGKQNIFSKMLDQRLFSLLYVLATGILPDKADRPFPSELLRQIQKDGIPSHFDDVKSAFHSARQGSVESYKALQKSAQVLYMVLYATVSYAHAHQLIQDQQQINKENLFQTLENMNEGLDRLNALIDEKLKSRNPGLIVSD